MFVVREVCTLDEFQLNTYHSTTRKLLFLAAEDSTRYPSRQVARCAAPRALDQLRFIRLSG